MSPLMKSLWQSHGGDPMAPPPLGCDNHERTDNELNIVPETESPSRPHTPSAHTPPQTELDLPPIYENLRVRSQPCAVNHQLHLKLDAAMRETMESLPQAQGRPVNYGMALDGVYLEVLMLGAAISAVPGLETASSVYTTVASGAERLSRTVQRATHLSRSFRGVGCTDENLSSEWVEVSPQDVPGAE